MTSVLQPETVETPLLVTRDNRGVVTLTLNRPDSFNALSMALMTSLKTALIELGNDASARVIVLAGSGKVFCAGHDLKEMRAETSEDGLRRVFELCSQLMQAITRCPKPVIARVHGIATAAGCQLVASCDLAVAEAGTRFAVSGINLGLFCATPMVALSRAVPAKAALEMLLTGEFIDAETALRYGLVNKVVAKGQLDAAVDGLAQVIAAKAPAAVALGKRLFWRQREVPTGMAYELACDVMTRNMMTEDAANGIDAFINKQPMPAWTGR
jgi:enoyl-CoA hydratase/carnithine racemase